MFIKELQDDEIEEINKNSFLLIKDANKKNPPKSHKVDAISLRDLESLVERANTLKLSAIEKLSLDVFIVAFATMSRTGEIARLNVEDILEEGTLIRIRPKNERETEKSIKKIVRRGGNLDPVEILRRRKKEVVFTLNRGRC